MSLGDHLQYLLQKKGLKVEDASAQAFDLAANPGDQKLFDEVAKTIGKHVLESVMSEWNPFPSRTVHLWRNRKGGLQKLRGDVRGALKTRNIEVGEEWVEASEKRKGEGRVRKVQITRTEVHARVSLTKTVVLPQEDDEAEPKRVDASWTVQVSSSPSHDNVLRTYGPAADSRKALVLFMEWLYDVRLQGAKERAEYFAPLKFAESSVRAFAKKAKMRRAWISGGDPSAKNGKYKIAAKIVGDSVTELDLTDDVVAAHDASPRDVRAFVHRFQHPDGFVEEVVISFFLTASPPHISFPWGGSRSAIDALVSGVVDMSE